MSAFAGTGTLLRLALRRERFALPAWIALLAVMALGTAARYAALFPDPATREEVAAALRSNRALLAFSGQVESASLGGLTFMKSGDMLYTLIGLMAILVVVRHTRAEEESGRRELVGGGVGRCAPLAAALVVAWAAALTTGLSIALGLPALGVEPAGALAFGLALAGAGGVFAGVAALTAQWAERARAATGLAALALGVGYALRFVADGSGALALRWLSPQGWGHLVRPFAGERWSVLALPLASALLLAGAALRAAHRRDLGAGLLPPRIGPARASAGLRGPLGLAWRLQRGPLLGWTLGFAAAGLLLGGLISTVPELAARGSAVTLEFFRRYAATPDAALVDVFLWLLVLSLGYVVALQPMLAALQLRREEAEGRAELLLAAPVPRGRWLASHLVFVALGPAASLTAAGLGIGLAHGLASGALATELPRALAGALIQLPAVWLMGGAAVLAFGALPRRAAAIVWSAYLFVQVFGEVIGPAFGLDYWVADLAVPFHHVPRILSGDPFTAAPLLILTALAAALASAGALAFARRDLT